MSISSTFISQISKLLHFQKFLKLDSIAIDQNFSNIDEFSTIIVTLDRKSKIRVVVVFIIFFFIKSDTFESNCTTQKHEGGYREILANVSLAASYANQAEKLACFQRVLIIQATTFRNEIRTRASPSPHSLRQVFRLWPPPTPSLSLYLSLSPYIHYTYTVYKRV